MAPDGGSHSRESDNDAEGRQRRRRRRRRGRGGDREGSGIAANAPQPPDDALEAMAKIGGLHPNGVREHETEDVPVLFFDDDKTQSPPLEERGRRSRRGRDHDVRKPLDDSGAEFADAPALEFELGSGSELPDLTGGTEAGERHSPSGRARRGRRAPRGLRAARAVDEGHERMPAPDLAPQRHESAAPLSKEVEEAVRDVPQAVPSAVHGAPGRDEIPSCVPEESAPPNALDPDPARPKRSGWWQRARASWRG